MVGQNRIITLYDQFPCQRNPTHQGAPGRQPCGCHSSIVVCLRKGRHLLCERCGDRYRDTGARGFKIVGQRGQGVSSIDSLFCESCETLLPLTHSVNEMLRKLSQLDRFRLCAESQPLLADAPENV